ncbi:valine--pyruvate transaminase [Suttonella sp. R2A3]|uniref:valine--pyruvate transaminase n=1 Tax=Suttonella sp. R2A3 TaxID=2908648 RepID=UPI001F275C88|nr:valine--pyruvate transaminase [Suttonella sp. R2A3]UJF24329.1 valine--pyruvate transaminase [Suttonella sp. R2A3]
MEFSQFGDRFTQKSGILQLMDDLGDALKSAEPVNMLGGGNPASIEAVNDAFLSGYERLGASALENMGNYSNPQGDARFIDALVAFFNRHYGWGITRKNIALTNGSQNAFFYLFNLFAGEYQDGARKNILLPLAPEYIGYSDVQVGGAHFSAVKPRIEEVTHQGEGGFFKYRVDFSALENHPDLLAGRIGAICCSRPTNPTGNVLTDEEMAHLRRIAEAYDVPLIVDNAYGMPFPNIIFSEATLRWDAQTILCLSLSKIGLPGVRCGIVLADEKVISAISALNAIINLAPTRFGAAIATPLLEDDRLLELSEQSIRPFYQRKADLAVRLLKEAFGDTPLRIHKPEGAIFLWLWFPDLPVNTMTLYQRLKANNTVIIPGEYFFPGIDTDDYAHAHQCIRMSIAQPDEVLTSGIAAIAEAVREAYAEGAGAA